MRHVLAVGDIYYSSWGWDQTNISYFQVVEVKSKITVVIREVKSKKTESTKEPMTGIAVPLIGQFKTEPMTRRIRKDGTLRINSYSSASIWDGDPKKCSWYA